MEQKVCFYHADRTATAVCTNCGAPICGECTCTCNDNKICPSCYETVIKQNISDFTRLRNSYIVYVLVALAFYVVGWIVFLQGSLGLFLIGILLTGIPNVYRFFNRGRGILATFRGWVWIILLEIIFGIVATPILIIVNLNRLVKAAGGLSYSKKQLADCMQNYPFLN